MGELSTEWLTEVLRADGVLNHASIQSIRHRTRDSKHALFSYLSVTYTENVPRSVPRNLFLKVNRPQRSYRGTVEVHAYQEIRGIRTNLPMIVRCYYGAEDSLRPGLTNILLDDVSHSHESPQLPLPSDNHRALITAATAGFHSYWWEHPKLGNGAMAFRGFPFMTVYFRNRPCVREEFDVYSKCYEKAYTLFRDSIGNEIPDEECKVIESIICALSRLWDQYLEQRISRLEGVTLLQTDAHWRQFLCPRYDHRGKAFMIDLDYVGVGFPAFDLAYRICLKWERSLRLKYENEIIQLYLRNMRERCGRSYSKDLFYLDYRLAIIFFCMYPVYFYTDDFLQEAAREGISHKDVNLWEIGFGRTLAAFHELHCEELLG